MEAECNRPTARGSICRGGAICLAIVLLGQTGFSPEVSPAAAGQPRALRLSWADSVLTIHGPHLPGGRVEVWYLEAYCRPGAADRDWGETVIGHETRLLSQADDGRELRLRCTLNDGVTVEHRITAAADEVDFQVVATNPTARRSPVQFAQPCIRVDRFTGRTQQTYLPKCFVFIDGVARRMPTSLWATEARYRPGQVWIPRGVDRGDANPRPLNEQTPSSGLIGCFSADDRLVLATAWQPYHELFQGVIVCLHADFRLGGLEPGETKTARGKIYIMDADLDGLVKRYERDF